MSVATTPQRPDRTEPTAQATARARASRRRGAALEGAILDAAWDELAAVGYANVTVAAVAARAHTNKAALYRRWRNRTELLAAAIDRRIPRLRPEPTDTGELRGDVIALLASIAGRCHATQVVPDPDGRLAAHLQLRAAGDGLEQMAVVLERARARGEITRPPRDTTARLPINVLHSELCLGARPVTGKLIAEIVDEAFLPLALS